MTDLFGINQTIQAIKNQQKLMNNIKKEANALSKIKITLFDQSEEGTIANINAKIQQGKGAIDLFTTAVSAAKTMQEAFTLAQMATPWGAIGALVGIVAGAFSLLGDNTDESTQKFQDLSEELEQSRQKFEDMKKTVREGYFEDVAEIETARTQVELLLDMLDEEKNGPGLDILVEDLINILPDAEDAVRRVNGQWRIQRDLLDEILEKGMEQAKIDSKKQTLTDANTRLETAEWGLEELAKTMDPKTLQFIHGNIEYEKAYEKAVKAKGGEPLTYEEQKALVDKYEFLYGEGISVTPVALDEKKEEYRKQQEEVENAKAELAQAEEEYMQAQRDYYEENANQPYQPDLAKELSSHASTYFGTFADYADIQEKIDIGNYSDAGKLLGNEKINTQSEAQEALNAQIQTSIEAFAEEQRSIMNEYMASHQQDLSPVEFGFFSSYGQIIDDAYFGVPEAIQNLTNQLTTQNLAVDITVSADGRTFVKGNRGFYTGENHYIKNAEGTNFWKGGYTVINERGDEMIELPTGSKIYPAQETGRKMEEITGGKSMVITGNTTIFNVREEADVDRITTEIVRKLERASLVMA